MELIVIELALMCLAQNIYFEANNQSIAGQVAVAQVTMNRVNSPDYPNDICSVVAQHRQFSWHGDGRPDMPRNKKAWITSQRVAKAVMAGSVHSELVNVLHYHAYYVDPVWAKKMKLVATIGDHLFYESK